MGVPEPETRDLYWIEKDAFGGVKAQLISAGYDLGTTMLTPCQVLKSRGKKLVCAPPDYRIGQRFDHPKLPPDKVEEAEERLRALGYL